MVKLALDASKRTARTEEQGTLIAIGLKIAAFLKDSIKGFFDHDCMRMAAALSYYAVFSLPPLLFFLTTILGYFFHSEDVRREVSQNLAQIAGKENAGVFDSLLTAADKVKPGIAGSVLGLCVLALGASVLMNEMQSALNTIWQVKPCKEKSGIVNYLLNRLLALSMLLILALLLVFSLLFNTVLSAFGREINVWFHSEISADVFRSIHFLMSFVLLTLLLALAFKILPNAPIRWKDVWLGAAVTTVLFALGNYLVGIYLGHSNPASVYGVAASLGVILVWIYYASMIILYGAEFTRTWAQWHHRLEDCKD
jgi:membrane protein